MTSPGVFLHVMADALGSVIVIISALIMWFLPVEDEQGQPIEANQWTMYGCTYVLQPPYYVLTPLLPPDPLLPLTP